jgi:uridine kinase
MIIQIRGTSGSGKTTVMRKVMEGFSWTPQYADNRRKPLYYTCGEMAVLGHYDATCGGCDNVGSARQVFDVLKAIEQPIILCEGLLLSEDVKWATQMEDLRVIFLTTSLDECLRRVRARREAAGNEKPFNEYNTTNRVGVIERARERLIAAGILCRRASVEQSPRIILNWRNEWIKNNRG